MGGAGGRGRWGGGWGLWGGWVVRGVGLFLYLRPKPNKGNFHIRRTGSTFPPFPVSFRVSSLLFSHTHTHTHTDRHTDTQTHRHTHTHFGSSILSGIFLPTRVSAPGHLRPGPTRLEYSVNQKRERNVEKEKRKEKRMADMKRICKNEKKFGRDTAETGENLIKTR